VAAFKPYWSHNTVGTQIFFLRIKKIGDGEVRWGEKLGS